MFVSFIMNPLVERYTKFFNEEVIASTAKSREAHAIVKEKLHKFVSMEDGILRMVIEHLPSPIEA